MGPKRLDGKIGVQWWYYMLFPFLAMFRMARVIFRLVCFYIRTGDLPYYSNLVKICYSILLQTYMWFKWWMTIFMLWISWCSGSVLHPLYERVFVYMENTTVSRSNKRSFRLCRTSSCKILTLPGSMCIFSEIHNVYAQDMVYLSRPNIRYENTIPNTLITKWNIVREGVGNFPPDGWPLKMTMFMFSILIMLYTVFLGYQRIWSASKAKKKSEFHSRVFQSQSGQNGAKLRSEVFDGNSDTIIVDNSANCVIWRHKRNFDPKTYIKIYPKKFCGVSSAVRNGTPVGVGDLNIGWRDDFGKYHGFVIPKVLHIPTSPVNILGVSAFSQAIGDYEQKGTRINSSGQDSIFSWNNGKFQKTFRHSEANMPEMLVNDGYSSFHKFCNFIDNICPISQQCYHTKTPHTSKSLDAAYECGEEIVYKNGEHIEAGIIESIKVNDKADSILYNITFRDDRKVTANADNILANDETDVSIVPTSTQDFVQQSKCLTAEEIKLIRHPHPLSKLQKEWKTIRDQFGHLPFAKMDQLVENNMLPAKFKSLKGNKILCPSCMFGKMRKRAWRSKGNKNVRTIRKDDEAYAGAKISVDQIVVAQPGLVPRISGRHTNARICGATGFYDNHTGYSFSSLQTSLDGDQTIAAKFAFESHADTCGIKVKKYRADNGRFAEKSFRDEVRKAQQKIEYCGVGAHHQNGIIERHFQTLSSQARIILLHAKRHWPAMISVILWPFAYKYAELLHNHMHVDGKGYSPAQKFCKTTKQMDFKDLHTWGSPCYVLDRNLQLGTMKAKWEPRSRLGIYLGHSPCHAGTVALVLNPKTLHVSPQFHVAFDDHFTTVPYLATGDMPPNWLEIVKKSEAISENDYDLAKLWLESKYTSNDHET